ncbi:hypothetical protein B0H34DRAFT_673963 [Crassisporium funariophilum]|nr:hypothetical protein B0H34DRAFT_673963 [Crassisporium funariophilum]
MFRTGSPYSPFFTSGLLGTSDSRPASPDPEPPVGPRRGSLPTDTSSRSSEHASAFYFTLQPRRDEHEFRSFLSLDLAESQSMRSASLKRQASSKAASSRESKAPHMQAFRFPRISEVPRNLAPSPTPLRMRFSRDSLRTIPSPKPAPSITLPELPIPIPSAPPRLPSLQPIPALELSLPAPAPAPVPAPTMLISRTPAPLVFSHRISIATKASSSTVSTRHRKVNRSEALARLEGRSKSAPLFAPSKRPQLQRNFMSMSDDEDEDGDDEDSDLDSLNFGFGDYKLPLLNPVMEPEDMVLPLPSPAFLEAPRSAPLPPRAREAPAAPRRRRTTKRTSKDWFPLKSFIDLHNDDEAANGNWSWRSFIEVANVS